MLKNRFRAAALALIAALVALSAGGVAAMPDTALASKLLPEPRHLVMEAGSLSLTGASMHVELPSGPENEACRETLRTALRLAGVRVVGESLFPDNVFLLTSGGGVNLVFSMPCPSREAYEMRVGPRSVAARADSPSGLLYAAETLLQLVRLHRHEGRLPCLFVRDSPEFPMRGIYVEGGQERFGRIVDADYLKAQIRRLAALKMNTMVVEAYNLFPFPSFPACADSGTLTRAECDSVFAEARKWHVTMVPSLQTLAQAYELVWGNAAGTPYRETTAPGLMCPSNPDIYPFIKGLYRDLLTLFSEAPVIGIGCSEIDMQWQSRYCPRCKARVDKGETVRDLLLGHAERCIRAVKELSHEMGRPVRPLMWADEFYMYGPGRDWVGIDRISHDTVMGFWKYWPDYAGISGLMEHGYDIFGVSAIYNHCFYLADLSPEDPKKVWKPMEQTGVLNIAGMARDAAAARRAHPDRQFLGIAAASFSKHRLRAFDSLWFGFALNGQYLWSRPDRPYAGYRREFLRSYVRCVHGTRSEENTEALARAYERLDYCKSRLEAANQTLHDVVGVVDTQEPGYVGNTLMGAWRKCGELLDTTGDPGPVLRAIRRSAVKVAAESASVIGVLDEQKAHVDDAEELSNLRLAAQKIRNHARRQVLLIDTRAALARAATRPLPAVRTLIGKCAARWGEQKKEVESILARVAPLCTEGDPSGYRSVLGDVSAIETHLTRLASEGPQLAGKSDGETLVDEKFGALDASVWEVLGSPRFRDGRMETAAVGGWDKYCGILSRQSFKLDARRPLVIEFDLTASKIGVDSQLLASSVQANSISSRFALAGSGGRLSVHTRSRKQLLGGWVDPGAGWRERSASPEIAPGQCYRLRAEITRGSWRVILRKPGESMWDMPFWDTGAIPMDDLAETRIVFADVEPQGGSAATRWGPIRISH